MATTLLGATRRDNITFITTSTTETRRELIEGGHRLKELIDERYAPEPNITLDGLSRVANEEWNKWVLKLEQQHAKLWRDVGLYQAIKDSQLGIAFGNEAVTELCKYYCPTTCSFIFDKREMAFTIEDAHIIGNIPIRGIAVSVLGMTDDEKTLYKKVQAIKKATCKNSSRSYYLKQWLLSFRDHEDEVVEHVGFFVYFLCIHLLIAPGRRCVSECAIIPAIRLAKGFKVALAPAVTANIYNVLNRIYYECEKGRRVIVYAAFWMLQVWIFERWAELSPICPLGTWNSLLHRWSGTESRVIANYHEEFSKHGKRRPYALHCKEGKLTRFYEEIDRVLSVEKEDERDEALDFLACIRPCTLVGYSNPIPNGKERYQNPVILYRPQRVATQFGYDQSYPEVAAAQFGCDQSYPEAVEIISDEDDAIYAFEHFPEQGQVFIPSYDRELSVLTGYQAWLDAQINIFKDTKGATCVIPMSRAREKRKVIGDKDVDEATDARRRRGMENKLQKNPAVIGITIKPTEEELTKQLGKRRKLVKMHKKEKGKTVSIITGKKKNWIPIDAETTESDEEIITQKAVESRHDSINQDAARDVPKPAAELELVASVWSQNDNINVEEIDDPEIESEGRLTMSEKDKATLENFVEEPQDNEEHVTEELLDMEGETSRTQKSMTALEIADTSSPFNHGTKAPTAIQQRSGDALNRTRDVSIKSLARRNESQGYKDRYELIRELCQFEREGAFKPPLHISEEVDKELKENYSGLGLKAVRQYPQFFLQVKQSPNFQSNEAGGQSHQFCIWTGLVNLITAILSYSKSCSYHEISRYEEQVVSFEELGFNMEHCRALIDEMKDIEDVGRDLLQSRDTIMKEEEEKKQAFFMLSDKIEKQRDNISGLISKITKLKAWRHEAEQDLASMEKKREIVSQEMTLLSERKLQIEELENKKRNLELILKGGL